MRENVEWHPPVTSFTDTILDSGGGGANVFPFGGTESSRIVAVNDGLLSSKIDCSHGLSIQAARDIVLL